MNINNTGSIVLSEGGVSVNLLTIIIVSPCMFNRIYISDNIESASVLQ